MGLGPGKKIGRFCPTVVLDCGQFRRAPACIASDEEQTLPDAMLPPLLDRTRPHPADKWLWALLAFLVVAQLVAFWMLCSDQVQKAEVRDAAMRAERLAMRDDCAPFDGRASCLPVDGRARAVDANGLMSTLR